MTWKRFQRVIWAVLAVCVGGIALLLLADGLILVGQVSSWDMMGVLFWAGLLALILWGDAALVKATRGWVRAAALIFALAAEGLLLFTVWFFSMYFNTGPEFIRLYGPTGEVELVVCEESWLFKVWGTFYRPAGPFLIQNTGVTYEAKDCWPFRHGYYEIEWSEENAVVHYDNGAGGWETCTVPLD